MNRYEEADSLVREMEGFNTDLGIIIMQFLISDNHTILSVDMQMKDGIDIPEARRIAYGMLIDDMELRGMRYKDLVEVPYPLWYKEDS